MSAQGHPPLGLHLQAGVALRSPALLAAAAPGARRGPSNPRSAARKPSLPNTAWWSRRKRWPRRIGADILQKGGNAVDAAVATGFAMAVTYPRAGNIGGGGFMVIHRATGEDTAIDYRETAPAGDQRQTPSSTRKATPIRKNRANSALAIGVPGTVAGLALAESKYGSGKFTLADLIAPAIALARDGIAVADDTADSLPRRAAPLGALAVLGANLS